MCYTDFDVPFEPLDLINPMDGPKTTLGSPHWYFGPDWPGRRCGAKTRRGTPCQKPALHSKSRCQLHGGRGGAPSGSANGNYRHGRFCRDKVRSEQESRKRVDYLLRLGRHIDLFK